MSRESLLARGRAAAEAGMLDTCIITRPGGGAVDDNTGVISGGRQQIYSGKCRVQQSAVQSTDQAQTPGQDYQLHARLELHLPITATGLKVDDLVEITAAANDPELVGQVLRVRDLSAKTEATARRLGVSRRSS